MRNKKNLAGKVMKVSPHKVKFAPGALEDIKKAITRSDIRGLIAVHKITEDRTNFHSRAGARKIAAQKKKGRKGGLGSRKGSKNSIVNKKTKWINRIRAQRELLKELRNKSIIPTQTYQMLCLKCKGGYFRNRRHIKLYLKEQNLVQLKK
ncbi:MAG: 50S ribosomal protein L19e [Nanoarchaeota archaeon]